MVRVRYTGPRDRHLRPDYFGWPEPGGSVLPEKGDNDENAYFIVLMLAVMAVAAALAALINLPGIVGAFLAGLAVNAAVHDKPAKEN